MYSELALAPVDWNQLFKPQVVWVLIPIVAVVIHGVLAAMSQINRHDERMAMIKRGLHPDDPTQAPRPESE